MNPPPNIASDTLVEAIARAIYVRAFQNCCNGELPETVDESWRSYESEAQAALTAITEAGFVVCPREPTPEMISAGIIERHDQPTPEAWSLATANIYRAMINAVTHCNHTNNGKAE